MKILSLKRMFWIIGALLFIVGLYGWYVRLAFGHTQANYGQIVPWGLWVAVYIYFIGLSAGSFLISSMVYVFRIKRFELVGRISLFTAFITLLLALLSIWTDIGHMERFWHVFAYPNFSSAMAWMIWLYTTYLILVTGELWFETRRDLARGAAGSGARALLYRVLSLGSRNLSDASRARDRSVVRVLATIGVPLAVMFHGGVGALFGVVAARPFWNTGLFPILFLTGALVSGGGLLIVVAAIFQDGLRRNRQTILDLGGLVLGLLLLDLLFTISDTLISFYSNLPLEITSWRLEFFGPFWWVFWFWQIGLGVLIPILLLATRLRRDPRWVALAGLLIALGFIAVRLNIVIPGLSAEEVAGVANAIASPRYSSFYFPSLSEWALSAGIVGLGLLLFGLGEHLLPKSSPENTHVTT